MKLLHAALVHARSITTRRLITVLCGLAMLIGTYFPVPSISAAQECAPFTPGSSGALLNGSFDSPVSIIEGSPAVLPTSVSNWTGYLGGNRTGIVARVLCPNPVHSGQASASVETTLGLNGGYWYQDVFAFQPDSSYDLTFWVRPEAGSQQINLIIDWDHAGGSRAFDLAGIGFSPTATSMVAFGQAVNGPAVTYGGWHQIRLSANASTHAIEFFVDGVKIGEVITGTPPPPGRLTLLVGLGDAVAPTTSKFYFDDFSLNAKTSGGKLFLPVSHKGSTLN